MSTRSRIAVLQPDGKVKSVYCHSDGYISYNGRMLTEHYNTLEKANELVNLGDLSFIEENANPLPSAPARHHYGKEGAAPILTSHSFENPQKGVTSAYHRDRQEVFNQDVFNDEERFLLEAKTKSHCEEYYYFFKEGKWFVSIGARGNFKPLTKAMTHPKK